MRKLLMVSLGVRCRLVTVFVYVRDGSNVIARETWEEILRRGFGHVPDGTTISYG